MSIPYVKLSYKDILHHQATYDCFVKVGKSLLEDWDMIGLKRQFLAMALHIICLWWRRYKFKKNRVLIASYGGRIKESFANQQSNRQHIRRPPAGNITGSFCYSKVKSKVVENVLLSTNANYLRCNLLHAFGK